MEIIARNTCILVKGYTLGDSEKLENYFKMWEPLTHKTYYIGMEYDENNKLLYLPSAIDVRWVQGKLGVRGYKREYPHPYKIIENIKMQYRPRDEEQEIALRFMCGVNEYAANSTATQLSLSLSTGAGKTYTSIATIAFLKMRSIIITGSRSLLNQWRTEILKFTNLTNKDITLIAGSEKINMILMGKSKIAGCAKIYLCTHATLRDYANKYGWDKLGELFQYLGIGLKFYDEAHTNFENMLKIDFHTNVWRTYYVTATPSRSDWRENMIYKTAFKNVPLIDLFNQDKDPHVHYNAILYNSRPTPRDISICKNKYGLDRMKYISYVTKKPVSSLFSS